MIAHQTVSMADPPVSFDDMSEDLEESLTVIVIEEDILADISPAGQMIRRVFKLHPEWPCHREKLPD